MKKIKVSHFVKLHQEALPAIEKVFLEVAWDEIDKSLLRRAAEELNLWGADPQTEVELDVPLGLGDTDALIRFYLSLYDLHQDEAKFRRENFERLLIQINRDVFKEIFEELYEQGD